MKKQWFTISVYSENNVGLLNRISGIFLKRHINIESLNVSKSEIDGVSKFTVVVFTTEDWTRKIVMQIEKQIEVIKAFYHTDEEEPRPDRYGFQGFLCPGKNRKKGGNR
jgi:acetolactate synthase-1/3 small subunit